TNPVIGTGYYSFWSGSRAEKIAEKNGYTSLLTQAHNRYLKMYLNGGAIGVFLLIALLAATGRRIFRQVLIDPYSGGVKLVFWVVVAVHNWSEASFARGGPLWFVLLVVILEY